MSDDSKDEQNQEAMLTINSGRFGALSVPADSVIEFPSGMIGFPHHHKYVLIEHKHPFSWLHSVEDANLAFVVVDGAEFGEKYSLKPPVGDRECDFREEDEYAILVVVTVRPEPTMTTANLKAPLFVNIRNRRGVQVIFDDSRYSTRHPLWTEQQIEEQQAEKQADKSEKK